MNNSIPTTVTLKKTKFPDSSLVGSLDYDGQNLIVEYKKNGSRYKYLMTKERAWQIYTAPSVGKAVLAMQKDIKGYLIEEEEI